MCYIIRVTLAGVLLITEHPLFLVGIVSLIQFCRKEIHDNSHS